MEAFPKRLREKEWILDSIARIMRNIDQVYRIELWLGSGEWYVHDLSVYTQYGSTYYVRFQCVPRLKQYNLFLHDECLGLVGFTRA